jgi:DNA-binding beta-propeller fold protein YncE
MSQVTELNPVTLEVSRQFSTGASSHPHGHWVSNDGSFVVTPNFYTGESTVVDLVDPSNTENIAVGFTPIATGMMPDGSKYFTADFLGNSLTVVDLENNEVRSIDLFHNDVDPLQGLPIQTPVSPDGQWMVTATVLQTTIVVVDANAEEVVAVLPCDPGCHGVQWGAKEGGGYYAYVSNKFSNALIVVDPKDGFNAEVVGKISLVEAFETETDDVIIDHAGMGGQGLLTVPNVYNGWIQQTAELCDVPGKGKNKEPCGAEISRFLDDLTEEQLDPSS